MSGYRKEHFRISACLIWSTAREQMFIVHNRVSCFDREGSTVVVKSIFKTLLKKKSGKSMK